VGVRVNCICPGSVSGERIDRVIAAEAQKTGRSEDAVRTEMTQISSLKSLLHRKILPAWPCLSPPAQARAFPGRT
jgi:NAD(P)-dependent dehydrogenase (short-subunit alcohol dehydrogenase family)